MLIRLLINNIFYYIDTFALMSQSHINYTINDLNSSDNFEALRAQYLTINIYNICSQIIKYFNTNKITMELIKIMDEFMEV